MTDNTSLIARLESAVEGSPYVDVRVRELTQNGDWPWRYVVEGLLPDRERKRWPWSRVATIKDPSHWVRLRHGVRGFQPLLDDDADALAGHYQAAILKALSTAGEAR